MQLSRSTYLFQRTSVSTFHPLAYFLAFTVALCIRHAFAAKEDSISYKDDNHPRFNRALEAEAGFELERYEPEFTGTDRSIIGRAEEDTRALGNNAPGNRNISQGIRQYWTFPNATLFGPKSPSTPGLPSNFEGQDVSVTPGPAERELYISLTTCRQPLAKDPKRGGTPDQLTLYVSTSSTNQQPNEQKNDHVVALDGGFGCLNISVRSDVYFGVYAPANEGYNGVYNYQLTASIDGFYASSYGDPNAFLVDSDTNSALLYTQNTTNITNPSDPIFRQWMARPPVFNLFVQNRDDPSILGLQNSVCGLQNTAQIQGLSDIERSMTAAGDGLPKQQFYVKKLDRNSTYYAIAAMIGNSTHQGSGVVGGGGTVWSPTNITTKSSDNCALLFNLSFCTSVAYAAPANPQTFNTTDLLAKQYDQYASSLYQNFSYSLSLIPCDTTSSAQYSLARNCSDCDAAYRQWLCAVTIPRCEDITNMASYLQPRAEDVLFSLDNRKKLAFNSSRNPMIDTFIKPGPYKELLPCEDMCYNLTRSCPAALGFACPLEGHGLNYSYGKPPRCNSPWTSISGAGGIGVTRYVAFYVALAAASVAML